MQGPQRAACSHCQAVLKIKDPAYFGKKCVCPKCNKSFILKAEVDSAPDVPDENPRNQRSHSGGAAIVENPAEIERTGKKNDVKSKIVPVARKSEPIEDATSADASDLQDAEWPSSSEEAEIVDDFEDADESEDEFPPPRSKRKSKPLEKPSGKAPAKNSKEKNRSKSGKGDSKPAFPVLFVGLATTGLALVVGLCCFMLLTPKTKGPSANVAPSAAASPNVAQLDLQWIPNAVTSVLQVNSHKEPNAVLFLRAIKEHLQSIVDSEEINHDSVDHVIVGLPTGSTIEAVGVFNSITVIRLNSTISAEIKNRISSYTSTTVEGSKQTLYSKPLGKRGNALSLFMFLPDDRTLVIGPENLIRASATEKRSPSRFQWVDGTADLIYTVSSEGEKVLETAFQLAAVNYDCLSISANFTDDIPLKLGVRFKDSAAAKTNLESVQNTFKAAIDAQVRQLIKLINDFAIESQVPIQLEKVSGSISAISQGDVVQVSCQIPNEAFNISQKIREDLK